MALASKLVLLQSKATQASQFVAKHGPLCYKQLLEQNKHYIWEPPTVEKCSIPGRYELLQKAIDYVKDMWKNRKELRIEDAGDALHYLG